MNFKICIIFILTLHFSAMASGSKDGINWPSFRGPGASGIAENYTTPTNWSIAESENIKWKTPIAGLGLSSPIIWADRIFVTAAVSGQQDHSLRVGLYGDIAPVKDDSVHKWFLARKIEAVCGEAAFLFLKRKLRKVLRIRRLLFS